MNFGITVILSYNMKIYCGFLVLAMIITSVRVKLGVSYQLHIVPSQLLNYSCPEDFCLNLEQFANHPESYIDSNTTLLFVGGNHILSKSARVSRNVTKLSVLSTDNNTNIFCEKSADFVFVGIRSVYIHGLIFSGCGGVQVDSVEQLVIENCTFLGESNSNTSLSIDRSSATITGTSFRSNVRGSYRDSIVFLPIDHQSSVGGALIVSQSVVFVNNCHFEDNKANIGGVIFSELASTITINNSSFISNHATGCYTGLCFGGVLAIVGSVSVSIHNSNFQNNTSEGDGGVAVILNGTLFVSHSDASNNTAMEYGGVIKAKSGTEVSISSCKFTHNSANGGGAIAAEGKASVAIERSTFVYNSVGDCDCNFDKHYMANYDGGAVHLEDHSVAIINHSNFSRNSAYYGGALTVLTSSSATVSHSIFHNNSVYLDGGTVQALSRSEVTFDNSNFDDNSAENSGGAVHISQQSIAKLNACLFNNNRAQEGGVVMAMKNSTVLVGGSIFKYNKADVDGGTVAAYEQSHVTILYSIFENNDAYHGAGVAILYNGTTSIIQDCQFTNNRANYGGVLAAIRESNVSIDNCKFIGNSAITDGATLYGYRFCIFTVSNSSFVDNEAGNNGGIHVSQESIITISESGFSDNKVGHDGAGVFIYNNTNLTINSCRITNNSAGGSGGGLYGRFYTSIVINNSVIDGCSAQNSGGGASIQRQSHVIIENCKLTSNTADYGGFMRVYSESTVHITGGTLKNNKAKLDGGVMTVYKNSTTEIHDSTLELNVASFGGVFAVYRSTLVLTESKFLNNTGEVAGVVRLLEKSVVFAIGTNFSYNKADRGGVFYGDNCNISIEIGVFVHNMAALSGGVVYLDKNGFVNFTDNHFIGNTAEIDSGVMSLYNETAAHITSCFFENNEAKTSNGGVASLGNSFITINNTIFTLSIAGDSGGAIYASSTRISITNNQFTNSKASGYGGVLSLHSECNLTVSNSTFTNNTVDRYGGAIAINRESNGILIGSTFVHNRATERLGGAVSLYCEVIVKIIDCVISHNEALESGAAIAVEESSTIIFPETFSESQIFQSQISDIKDTHIVSNVARFGSGGGIYLIKSRLQLMAQVNITGNEAHVYGGGIHAVDSNISFGGVVFVGNNTAKHGGGASLENSELFDTADGDMSPRLHFESNQADLGGALFVNDDRSNDTCSNGQNASARCFFGKIMRESVIKFDGNHANSHKGGDNLYGGLLDRCKVDININGTNHTSWVLGGGVDRFMEISSIKKSNLDTIRSQPVNLCFCLNGEINCNQNIHTIKVMRGDPFSISIAAVDQVKHSVNATVRSSFQDLTLPAKLASQSIDAMCSSLEYQVSFPRMSTNRFVLTLYADGPCNNKGISKLTVYTEIRECHCGPGFMPQNNTIRCVCGCDKLDKDFSSYINECDSSTDSVIRQGFFWITYLHNISDENESHYLIIPYCPVDYCLPSSRRVAINLSLSNGSDAQCDNNRSGLLCGSCRPDYSLSLGSSKCMKCPKIWYGNLIGITVGAFFAGLILVALMLLLNLTVAIGTLNSIILYANIINTNRSVYFRQPSLVAASVLISWLNLEIGVDICFIEGMDMYAKMWIQLAFPLYIIIIVIVIILVSSCSSRFSKLIGKRDPVATLATLILLSYTKLLQTIITTFSFVNLKYPNDTYMLYWFPDPSIGFVNLRNDFKLGALIVLALIVLIATLLYTTLIFAWQCLIRCPGQSKIFKWIRNQKLQAFIETYHTPYTAKYRYWTGLLLLVRTTVYFIAAAASSSEQPITALSTVIILWCLFLYQMVFAIRLYKSVLLNVVESAMYFNIAMLALITQYTFSISEGQNSGLMTFQAAAAHISVGATVILLVSVIGYHIYRYGSTINCSCLHHTSKLNSLVSNPPLDQDSFESSENVFLDVIDSPRVKYSTPFLKLPTTTDVFLTGRKLSKLSKNNSPQE